MKNILELVEAFKFEKIFELPTANISDELADKTVTGDISYTLYTAENRCHECPRLLIKILDQAMFALIDTGCELSIMNEHLYNRLRHEGLKCFELLKLSVALFRERTIPTERPPPVGEVSANFCG